MIDIKAFEAKLNLLGITDKEERTKHLLNAVLKDVGDVTISQAIQLACEPYMGTCPVVALPEIDIDRAGRIWFIFCDPEKRAELKDWLEDDFVPGMSYPNYIKMLDIVHSVLEQFNKTEPSQSNLFTWYDRVLYYPDKPECDDYYINETPGIILVGEITLRSILEVWLNEKYTDEIWE